MKRQGFNSISLGTLMCIVEVARHESLTDAAKALKISQPAVSMQLKRFEKITGRSAFQKKGNKISTSCIKIEEIIALSEKIDGVLSRLKYCGNTNTPSLGISNMLSNVLTEGSPVLKKILSRYCIKLSDTKQLNEGYLRNQYDAILCPVEADTDDNGYSFSSSLIAVHRPTLISQSVGLKQRPLKLVISDGCEKQSILSALKTSNIEFELDCVVNDPFSQLKMVSTVCDLAVLPRIFEHHVENTYPNLHMTKISGKIHYSLQFKNSSKTLTLMLELFDLIFKEFACPDDPPPS